VINFDVFSKKTYTCSPHFQHTNSLTAIGLYLMYIIFISSKTHCRILLSAACLLIITVRLPAQVTPPGLRQEQQTERSYPMGATARDIEEQGYRATEQRMGMYINRPYRTAEENRQAMQEYLRQQQHQQSLHRQEQHSIIAGLLNEARTEGDRHGTAESAWYHSPEFAARTRSYADALGLLSAQLAGSRPLSVSEAYFVLENAWGESYLSRDEYEHILDHSAGFIRAWLRSQNLSPHNQPELHFGIQKFMRDTLSVLSPHPDQPGRYVRTTHLPFFYDYVDFRGEKDFRSYFLTKCLATGGGQCNSMPAVYCVLAERLGATAYLSLAPHHALVKYSDAQGRLHNYEATTGWHISNRWYEDNLFISPEAKRSGIYLDTLSRKQIVANCLLDLALGYMQKFGIADGSFINQCIDVAMTAFPRRNALQAYLLRSSLLAGQLERLLRQQGITDVSRIDQLPEARQLRDALLQNEATISRLGYQPLPEALYESLMRQHEFKGSRQEQSGQQKRNRFIQSF